MRDRYRHALIWESSSIAYHARTLAEVKQPLCGSLKKRLPFNIPFVMQHCNSNIFGYVLCELDINTNLAATMTARHLLEMGHSDTNHTTLPTNLSWPLANLISCPAKHLTFSFLACDVLSQCYVENDDVIYMEQSQGYHLPTPSACLANLTSLPPSLLCESGGHRVPYTLVCDHRDDCGDDSDEDFCVFPFCDTTVSVQCSSSKQVSGAEAGLGVSSY